MLKFLKTPRLKKKKIRDMGSPEKCTTIVSWPKDAEMIFVVFSSTFFKESFKFQ